jgi:hypothetical protein
MKKLFLLGMLCLSVAAMADDVQKIDVSKVSKITFEGDNVVITYNNGTATTTADMATVVLDFSSATGIEERVVLLEKEGLEGKAVYNLNGQQVGNSAARLTKGVYIINGKKVIVK